MDRRGGSAPPLVSRARLRVMSRFVLVLVAALLLAGATATAAQPAVSPHFLPSGTVAASRHLDGASPGAATTVQSAPTVDSFGAVTSSATALSAGPNVNVVGSADVTQKATISGASVATCNPGKQTAQNETTIAVNPANASYLVAGVNDYRIYEPSEHRYDGSGGYFRSGNAGGAWTAGFLPGLVRANSTAPGPYQSA